MEKLLGLCYVLMKKMAASQQSCKFLEIFSVVDFVLQEGTLTLRKKIRSPLLSGCFLL